MCDIDNDMERENVFVYLSIAWLLAEVYTVAVIKIEDFTWKLLCERRHKNMCLMGIHICTHICLVIYNLRECYSNFSEIILVSSELWCGRFD